MKLKKGDHFPSFTLNDQNTNPFNLANVLGKENLVVYFYPKNETFGCTMQACKFRDEFNVFRDLQCKVVGISSDSPKSHLSFIKNHKLPFTLLSDKKQKVRKELGLPSDLFGLVPGRITFVINKKGIIVEIIDSSVNMNKHIYDAIIALKD
ncbi:MAG: peroxiredoxin [Bacteroidota bacterium]|nr:peroxiredoxin [Bacteroidota bacterium]MEC8968510.1 peroxiredoxin [Bacteroidota bacterium]